jgi:hypothetical protein
MPKPIMTTGSGMTERSILRFDWGQPEDAEAQVKAAIETFDRSSFARLSRRLAELAMPILDQAGLPSDPEGEYLVTSDGAWAPITDEMDLGPELEDAHLSLEVAVMLCGYPHDSPEGYAARVLMTLRVAQDQLEAGHLDEAMALAFAAGELVTEAAMKGVFEKDYLAGAGARDRMRKVHEEKYGTVEEVESRDEAIRQAVDSALAKGFRKMKVYKAAAERFRTSVSTVQRALRQKKNQG